MNRRKSDALNARRPALIHRVLGLVTFLAGAALVLYLAAFPALSDEARKTAAAPVVVPKGGALVQTGWYRYAEVENAAVLYCVPEGDTTLTCVVYIVPDKGPPMIVGVPGVRASEIGT